MREPGVLTPILSCETPVLPYYSTEKMRRCGKCRNYFKTKIVIKMVPTVKRLQIDQSRNLMNRNESRSNAGLEFTAVHTWAVYPSSTLSLQNNSSKAAVQVLMEIMWNWALFCILTICLVQFNNISVFGIYLKFKSKKIAGLKILNVKKKNQRKKSLHSWNLISSSTL